MKNMHAFAMLTHSLFGSLITRGCKASSSTRLFTGGFSARRFSNENENNNNNAIQNMYNSLSSITNIEESMQLSTSCPHIAACLDAMNCVTFKDLGIDDAFVQKNKDSVCMNIVNMREFDIQVFVIPKGKELPLHDHPNMMVLSKLITGSLSVRSFNCEKANNKNSFISKEIPTKKTSSDNAWLLTPQEGNIHELKGEENSIVLDVLMPPYMQPDRPCNYYRSVEMDGDAGKNEGRILEIISDPPDESMPYMIPYKGIKPIQKKTKGQWW